MRSVIQAWYKILSYMVLIRNDLYIEVKQALTSTENSSVGNSETRLQVSLTLI